MSKSRMFVMTFVNGVDWIIGYFYPVRPHLWNVIVYYFITALQDGLLWHIKQNINSGDTKETQGDSDIIIITLIAI